MKKQSIGVVFDVVLGQFRTTFRTPYDQYADRIGQRFSVIRELTDAERGAEVGTMYRIRFADGTEIDAWPEEVCVDSE
jgi:hypothetical protein